MNRVFKLLAIIALLISIGCSINEEKTETFYFTGVIKEINGNSALVSSKAFDNNPEGDVYVDLSINNEGFFVEGDKIKVGYDGNVMESYPLQINTLSVELIDK